MTPLSGVSEEQQALVAFLDKAIAGTQLGVELADATQEARDDFEDTSAFDLPEYQRFSEMSAEITRDRDAAMARWTAAVDARVRQLKHPKGAPNKPVV